MDDSTGLVFGILLGAGSTHGIYVARIAPAYSPRRSGSTPPSSSSRHSTKMMGFSA